MADDYDYEDVSDEESVSSESDNETSLKTVKKYKPVKEIDGENDDFDEDLDSESDNDENDELNEDDDSDIEINEDDDIENAAANKKPKQTPIETLFPMDLEKEMEDEDEEEDDDEEDEDYLKKLDEHQQKKIINDHHPELKTLNYEEIESLCVLIKDEKGNIIDPLHKTPPFLSRYERARVLGERAEQINHGAKPFIEIEPTMIDGYLIALKELEQKKIPFIIQRPLPNGGCEYWKLHDLEQL
jgi:DNA-directed RNA polymerase I, II, and III subunit RPABC2